MTTQIRTLPKVLTFSEIKYYIFLTVFTGLAVFTPWALHQFNLAGPQFLPMHFFVLIAGFLFGWRAGMMVGVFSPMFSYGMTQLPPLAILPETMLELAVYGFAIGVLREKQFNIFTAIIPAMILGRLARLAFVFGLGLQTNPLKFFEMSWPGIVLQLAVVPAVVFLIQKYISDKNGGKI